MTTRLDAGVTYTQSWDAQNRLGSVAAPARNTAWVYDADGARVSKNDGAVTTVYIGGSVEVQISGTLRLTTTYYFFGGARIAMRAGTNVTFLHPGLRRGRLSTGWVAPRWPPTRPATFCRKNATTSGARPA